MSVLNMPLEQLRSMSQNKRVVADQCRREAAEQSKRAERYEQEALAFERAVAVLESSGKESGT